MATRSTPTGSSCAPRSLWGWSPPPLPADTWFKRLVDKFLPRTGLPVVIFFGSVIGLLVLGPHLPRREELAVDGVAALAAAGWCGLNFWRCRHAHCAVTAAGLLPLAALAFMEAGLGRTLIHGYEQLVFLGVLATGIVFEGVWYVAKGTNSCAGSTEGGGVGRSNAGASC